jgi:hypothetical protein
MWKKPMLFVMVNASPGGVNRQVVVLSRPGRCNRPRMGVDNNGDRRPILATGIDNHGIYTQRKAATNYKSTG